MKIIFSTFLVATLAFPHYTSESKDFLISGSGGGIDAVFLQGPVRLCRLDL